MTEVATLGSIVGGLSQKLCEAHICWLSVPLTVFLCWLPPLADCFWLSASGCLHLVVCLRLSASGCLPPAVCLRLSASGCLHLVVCSTVDCCCQGAEGQLSLQQLPVSVSPTADGVASHSMLSSVLPVPRQKTESTKTVTTITITTSIHYILYIFIKLRTK